MSEIRTGRQKYYDVFSHFYDVFIKAHAGRHRSETRNFLVNSADIEARPCPKILDICCGTGSVILAFSKKYPAALAVGYDFSWGMLQKARGKDIDHTISFVQGDAARLPYVDDCFDIVCCSHALYELKGKARTFALLEMKRVVQPDGKILLMEHEVPRNPLVKILFYLRMLVMGSADTKEFVRQDISQYQSLFADIQISHTPSGKSKLITCVK
ncbi:methyltransferase domain-containing protein [Desulfobulbus rhabdoformis]|uniref:class I SAM-dependent methyltransferase n=1 Tax=Desulfobulbus rhabdoformis TaxID=34032 RepID=UPI001966A3BE|nr:methyltransferase domain-containing protein [Desulfobulbus rhabdoformis]MBM9616594.1 methyltransferase domain-containing protein [Desulfobulbus rhabdoformis]